MTQTREALVGLIWGDEGKGKLVDERAAEIQQQNERRKRLVIVRYQGGNNAGHTVHIHLPDDKVIKFVTHAAPTGLTNNSDIAIGPAVAFDPESFLQEVKEAEKLFNYNGRILISERAGVLLDYHRQIDKAREDSGNHSARIGTTRRGIGPFYEDNARRVTRITFYDYISPKFPQRLKEVMKLKIDELEKAGINIDDLLERLSATHEPIRKELAPFAENLEYRLREYLNNEDSIILEGAQGTYLDVDLGTIPTVSSSHILAPHAFASLGLPRKLFNIIGVEKIYPTRVGDGILPTLSGSEFGEIVVERGLEVGASTGRRRRVGYPDWTLIKRAVMLNDCDGIILTRADIIQDLDVKVCTGYKINGRVTDEVPFDLSTIQNPIYLDRTFRWHFWNEPTGVDKETASRILRETRAKYTSGGFESLESLPGLLDFISMHDKYIGCPIVGIGIGPHRGETVRYRKGGPGRI